MSPATFEWEAFECEAFDCEAFDTSLKYQNSLVSKASHSKASHSKQLFRVQPNVMFWKFFELIIRHIFEMQDFGIVCHDLMMPIISQIDFIQNILSRKFISFNALK
jgi:hypothetical protein